jgi:hypothetical protein
MIIHVSLETRSLLPKAHSFRKFNYESSFMSFQELIYLYPNDHSCPFRNAFIYTQSLFISIQKPLLLLKNDTTI